MSEFLPANGGYRSLRVFAVAEAIYDLTAIFVERFIPYGSRTSDQMVQAARSGRQNIAEGSSASATSKETEIKLTNVAKSSLEELLLDYEDYLRQHNLPQWTSKANRTEKLRNYLCSDRFNDNPTHYAQKMDAEEYCNLCITLINQATYMLRRLLATQQEQFVEQGGIKELMFKARTAYRNGQTLPGKSDRSDRSDRSDKSDKSDKSDTSDNKPKPTTKTNSKTTIQ